jgi:hypothetical protein
MNKVKTTIIQYLVTLVISALILQACDDNTSYPAEGNTISGQISFVDTHFVTHNGYYGVALYPYLFPAFSNEPIQIDTLILQGTEPSEYELTYDGYSNYFFLAVVWMCDSCNITKPYVMGAYGNDTIPTGQRLPTRISFPNNPKKYYNILAWADTSKRIYQGP